MNTLTPQQQKNGWDAEEALRKLLDKEGFAHLPFCENASKFSTAIRDFLEQKDQISWSFFGTWALFLSK